MSFVLTRRAMIGALASGAFASNGSSLKEKFAAVEKQCGGRLGVAVLDTGSGEMIGHNANQRFAMCSSFKMLLVGAVLQRCDAGRERIARQVNIPHEPLLSNSPLTAEHAGAGMSVRDLCRAAIIRSDNTAANLLLESIGGPSGVTRFARSLGDDVTRLDRMELELNDAAPGDPRDTTSPRSMAGNLRQLILGPALSAGSRAMLTQWMVENQTGDDRLRAGFAKTWRVADKTGSNADNTTNDIGVVWPGSRSPIVVAVYLTECPGPEEKRNAVLAQVARLTVQEAQGVRF